MYRNLHVYNYYQLYSYCGSSWFAMAVLWVLVVTGTSLLSPPRGLAVCIVHSVSKQSGTFELSVITVTGEDDVTLCRKGSPGPLC